MAQGEFTKEEIEETRKAVQEVWEALTKSKRTEFFGHLNDVFLFLDAAEMVMSSLTGSEAVYGFVAWLSTQPGEVVIGSAHTPPIETIKAFIDANRLAPPRENWTDYLTHPC